MLVVSTGSQRREIQKQLLNRRNEKRKPTCKRSLSPLFGIEACLGVMQVDLLKCKVSPITTVSSEKSCVSYPPFYVPESVTLLFLKDSAPICQK